MKKQRGFLCGCPLVRGGPARHFVIADVGLLGLGPQRKRYAAFGILIHYALQIELIQIDATFGALTEDVVQSAAIQPTIAHRVCGAVL